MCVAEVGYGGGPRTISALRGGAGHLNPHAGHLTNAADGQDLEVRILFGVLRSGGGLAPLVDEKIILGSFGLHREPAVPVPPVPHDPAAGAFVSGVGARRDEMQDLLGVAPELISYGRVNAVQVGCGLI